MAAARSSQRKEEKPHRRRIRTKALARSRRRANRSRSMAKTTDGEHGLERFAVGLEEYFAEHWKKSVRSLGFRDHLSINTSGTTEWSKFVEELENVQLARKNTKPPPVDLLSMVQDQNFQGHCSWCGVHGHLARDCRKRTEHTQHIQSNGWSGTHNQGEGKPGTAWVARRCNRSNRINCSWLGNISASQTESCAARDCLCPTDTNHVKFAIAQREERETGTAAEKAKARARQAKAAARMAPAS